MSRRRKSRTIRTAERLRDPGPDPSGNFSPSPYATRGHVVEIAPQELRSNPNSAAFPKRIATQRVIDRYRARGHIDEREWKAADELWRFWCEAGQEARQVSTYDPVMVQSTGDPSGLICTRVDAATEFVAIMAAVPYHCQGCVRAVVIEDLPAGAWSRARGFTHRDAETHGLTRLRQGLQALAKVLGY